MAIRRKVVIHQVKEHQVSGSCFIQSSDAVCFDKVSVNIVIEARGSMSGYHQRLTGSVLAEDVSISTNDSIEFPFCIRFDSDISSYKGKQVTVKYGCELCLEPSHDDKSGLAKLGDFLQGLNGSLTTTKYFKVMDSTDKQYYIDDEVLELAVNYHEGAGVIIFVLIVLLYIPLFAFAFMNGLILGVFHFIGLVIGAIFFSLFPAVLFGIIINSYRNRGTIKPRIQLKSTDSGFSCQLINEEFIIVEDLKIRYLIKEFVKDDRGSTTTTHNSVVYKSEFMPIASHQQAVILHYPRQTNLQTFSLGEQVKLNWYLEIVGIYAGKKKSFLSEEFSVGRR